MQDIDRDLPDPGPSLESAVPLHYSIDVAALLAKVRKPSLSFSALADWRVEIMTGFFSPSRAASAADVAARLAEIEAKQAAEKRGMSIQTPRVFVLDGDVAQGSLTLRQMPAGLYADVPSVVSVRAIGDTSSSVRPRRV